MSVKQCLALIAAEGFTAILRILRIQIKDSTVLLAYVDKRHLQQHLQISTDDILYMEFPCIFHEKIKILILSGDVGFHG